MSPWNRSIVLTALALSAALSGPLPAGSAPAPLERVGVEVAIGLADPEQAIYECTAVVTDLATNRVISAPRVLVRAGEDAKVRTGTQPGLEVLITVSVNAEQTVARYEARVTRDGEVVSSQKVRIALGAG